MSGMGGWTWVFQRGTYSKQNWSKPNSKDSFGSQVEYGSVSSSCNVFKPLIASFVSAVSQQEWVLATAPRYRCQLNANHTNNGFNPLHNLKKKKKRFRPSPRSLNLNRPNPLTGLSCEHQINCLSGNKGLITTRYLSVKCRQYTVPLMSTTDDTGS